MIRISRYTYRGIKGIILTLLEINLQNMVGLDSCVVIGIIKSTKTAKQISHLLKGNSLTIALQDVVLVESQRKLKLSEEEIIQKITQILRKDVHVFVTTDSMKSEAKRLEEQYGICHFPDSLILSAAKLHSWTLLSNDGNLIRTAEFEGILGLNPSRGGIL